VRAGFIALHHSSIVCQNGAGSEVGDNPMRKKTAAKAIASPLRGKITLLRNARGCF
jgi:hypothetical protein